jgi:FixJ family two-component response regulator
MSATVYVVDDDAAVRKSIGRLLAQSGLSVVEFETAQAFLEAVDPAHPGCVVLDIRMPGMTGLELQEELNRRRVTLPVIIVTGHGDVPMAVHALRAGAIDFIEKPYRASVLLHRIQEALAIDVERRQSGSEHAAARERLSKLTPREREVIDLLATGLNNKQVALRLGVSPQAVDATRGRAFGKLEIDNVAQLVRLLIAAQAAPAKPNSPGLPRATIEGAADQPAQ